MAKPKPALDTKDLYRGFDLTLAERQSAAKQLAAVRFKKNGENITYKSALRAIQRSTTAKGKQQLNPAKDVQAAVVKAVTEERNKPDESSPQDKEGFTYYWENSAVLEDKDRHTAIYFTAFIDDKDLAIETADEYAQGETKQEVEGEGQAIICKVTLVYFPPHVDRQVVPLRSRKGQQFKEDIQDAGYKLEVTISYPRSDPKKEVKDANPDTGSPATIPA